MVARRIGTLLLVSCVFATSARVAVSEEQTPHIEEPTVTESDRDHWSFRPLTRPDVPPVGTGWARTPIDQFIAAELQSRKLTPLPAADRVTLVRRLYFDLTGLPPTPKEVDRFAADPSPAAYDTLVSRLLTSPRHGEHWGQTWLDLARFAETDGFEHDKVRGDAWRYRDWVIEALNDDLPYDHFVRLQLAGDEVGKGDQRVATAFCLSGPDMPDINSQEERRHNLLNEVTATIGSVLLGLQVGCAQCHDHKYDPISQADFYRLRAIFEPAVHLKRNRSISLLREDTPDASSSFLMVRGDWRRKGPVVHPHVPRVIAKQGTHFVAVDRANSSGRRSALADWLTRADNPLLARVIVNRLWQHHFGDGLSRTPSDFGLIGDEPSHPELLDWLATELIRRDWSLKELHRLIVTSAVYRQASRPSSADWSEQRTRDAQVSWQASVESDPRNYYLARFPRRRLSGEAIRDAMLAASDTLSYRTGGPGVRPPLPVELVRTLLKNQWTVSPNVVEHHRRSIYVFARRNLRYPIFEAFDRPDGNASCPRRGQSTTAPQSLLLLNSELSLEMARRLAGYASTQASDLESQVAIAFRRAFGRQPTAAEVGDLMTFVAAQSSDLADSGRSPSQLALPIPWRDGDAHQAAALTDLCLALLNSSEFLYID